MIRSARRVSTPLSLVPGLLAIGLAVSGLASVASGQSPEMAPIPQAPEPGDLSEVEDVVDDTEVLPRSEAAPETDAGRANVRMIEEMQAEELSLSNSERRASSSYGVSIGAGTSHPWQTFTVDAFSLVRPNVAFGMCAGTGSQTKAGAALAQTYDLTVAARSFGFLGRYYFERVDGLSLEASLGYASWEGRLDPHGGDEDLPDDTDKLSAGYSARGLSGAAGLVVDWALESGVFIDWTVVGAQRADVHSIDLTRESPGAARAVTRDLERAAFFGITNVRIGYYF